MTAMGLGYDLVYGAAGLLSSPMWGTKMLRTGKWRTDWRARRGHCRVPRDDRPTVLIHGVSVGEVNLVRDLVHDLQARETVRVVVSTTTDTGTARAKALYEPDVPVVRFPLDFTRCVRRFLDEVRPSVAALVELEVWPNFIGECRRRNVPVCVINGRLSAKSFANYHRGRALVRPTFARLAAAAMQTPAYAQRIRQLGIDADRVHVLDSMKWDTAKIEDAVQGAQELGEALGLDRSRPLIVAGSTGRGEERVLIDTRPAEAQLLLVPRHPERFNEVAALAPDIVRRTHDKPRAADVYLLDTMGELRKAHALADVVFVGRSINGWGGSDPLEPIGLGKPTVIGPDYGNFQDMVDTLKAAGGIEVSGEPMRCAARLLEDREAAKRLADNGRGVIRSRQGATQRHAELLMQLLEQSHAVHGT